MRTRISSLCVNLNVLPQDTGHEFWIGGVPRKFRGTIGYFSGDNVGSQLMGGFKESSR